MIGVIIAALAVSTPAPTYDQKSVLPNGVSLFLDADHALTSFHLCMFVSTHGIPERTGQSGYRHLLEHLIARGLKGDIDAKLESRGVFLNASTLVDGIRFEMEGPPESLASAVQALSEFLTLREITQDEIDRELTILDQEEAVRPWASRLASSLYEHAYGTSARDPHGDALELKAATPGALRAVYDEMFDAQSTAIAIVGSFNQKAIAVSVENAVQSARQAQRKSAASRKAVPLAPEDVVPGAFGRARGAIVGSTGKSDTLAKLAAALALAIESRGATVAFSPSPIDGVVTLVHPDRGGLDDVDRLIEREAPRLFPIGKSILARWLDTLDTNPREKARAYSQMIVDEPYFRIEDVRQRADDVTLEQFVQALNSFKSDKCVRLGGER